MILSPERFRAIVASLRSDAACGRNAEQRAEPRVGLRTTATIVLRADASGSITRRQVRVRDVSAGGMGLIADEPIAPDGTFVLDLRDARARVTLVCRAVRCQSLGNGLFRIGARFEQCKEAPRADTSPPQAA